MDDAPLLSDEWLSACNAALVTLARPEGRAAGPGPLVVTELVTGAPAGTHDAVTLVADDRGVRLVAGRDDAATAWFTVSFADVQALHSGELDPARALTEGRVRVRGDLRAVVDAVDLLASAHAAMRAR